jgi:hypothetical protein
VPNLRTTVTELGTALGLLGQGEVDQVLARRPAVMRTLSPDDWDRLAAVRAGGAYDAEFHAAWENGRAFLAATDGLRGRTPEVVEWKGNIRAVGDEAAPADLRVDHVYLVSCKYLSKILFNVSPVHVFDDLLVGGQARRGRSVSGDWYADVAAEPYQELYQAVRLAALDGEIGAQQEPGGATPGGGGAAPALPGLAINGPVGRPTAEVVADHPTVAWRDLPARAIELTSAQRSALSQCLKAGWPAAAKVAYRELSDAVAAASVARWRAALSGGTGAAEAMLWRLLRMGSAPYFVLGSSPTRSLRLRIATPWDWRQRFALDRLEIFTQVGGQPRVGWLATVQERASGQIHEITGHVEVRWSHGRFGGSPEAKGYLDTPHHLVPGYFPLQ